MMFNRNLTLVFGRNSSGKTRFIREHIYDAGLPVCFQDLRLSQENASRMNKALELFHVKFRVVYDPRYSCSIGICFPDTELTVDFRYASSGEISLITTLDHSLQIPSGSIGHISCPEESLHPSLQVELGSFFAELVRDSPASRYVIETHSEHLMLRLLKLIREKRFSKENVTVYVMVEGVAVETLIDEEGEFVDNWPGGFFRERAAELF